MQRPERSGHARPPQGAPDLHSITRLQVAQCLSPPSDNSRQCLEVARCRQSLREERVAHLADIMQMADVIKHLRGDPLAAAPMRGGRGGGSPGGYGCTGVS